MDEEDDDEEEADEWGTTVDESVMNDEEAAAAMPSSFTKYDDLEVRLFVELLRTMPAAAADLALEPTRVVAVEVVF